MDKLDKNTRGNLSMLVMVGTENVHLHQCGTCEWDPPQADTGIEDLKGVSGNFIILVMCLPIILSKLCEYNLQD